MMHALNAVLNTDTAKMEEYLHLIKGEHAPQWSVANSKETVRLAQGNADNSV